MRCIYRPHDYRPHHGSFTNQQCKVSYPITTWHIHSRDAHERLLQISEHSTCRCSTSDPMGSTACRMMSAISKPLHRQPLSVHAEEEEE